VKFLLDENMPRSLQAGMTERGFDVWHAVDIGLRGRPDEEVLAAAAAADRIIITRDKGFTREKLWPPELTAGVIVIDLPDTATADVVTDKILRLLSQRLPVSLLGALTIVDEHRALSRTVRRRPK
jgi:predicted nuclease of predicted toxin-antitoxin system